MRLVELDPAWWICNYWRDETGLEGFDPDREGMGISFQCPLHRGVCRFGIAFLNPIDGKAKSSRGSGKRHDTYWARTGDTFETLTLTPSLHVIDDQDTPTERTHWHGTLINGEVSG